MSASFSSSYFYSRYFFLIVFVALFHFCSANKNLDDVLCMDTERQALLKFKHTLVDESHQLASWVSDDKDCCSWVGIGCDNVTGHVHRIHLPGVYGHCNGDYRITKEFEKGTKTQILEGDLSPSLLNLKQLKHLDLSCNDFGGIQVPSFIGSFGNLRYLNLSRSRFGGIIPPQLGNLSELHVLCLGSFYDDTGESELTSMMNMKWLSSLRLLKHLDMSGVDLSKAIDWVQVIKTIPSLVELHLSRCQLANIQPHDASLNQTSLSLLNLSFNDFTNSLVPRWIFSTTSLVSLDLSWCSFHGPIPSSTDSFRNLTSLKFLHVPQNNFINSSLVLKGLSSVSSNLISLDIRFCGVSSPVLGALCNLTSVISLSLSENQLTNAIPKSLGNLCNLRNLDLNGNNFRNISLTYLLESFFECKSPSLESLSLQYSRLSSHLPDQLGQLIHMKHLQLGNNRIVGMIPDSIVELSFLNSLILNDNLICGPIPNSIGRLSSLETLDISFNQLNGSLPDSLGQLSKLETLYLAYNQLNGSLPESLGQLSKLGMLDFSYNFLTGVVTEAHFAKLARLKYLRGIDNKLTLRPRLANWIPSFQQLQFLNLNSWDLGPQFPLWVLLQRDLILLDISNTRISSTMPESFWLSLPNLQYLVMSQNHIQGRLFVIPAPLVVLDLSSNNFSGQLPRFSNSSLAYILDLSNNSFVGSLHHLLCSYDAISVEVLSVANNHLSGVIPECWVKWPSLSYLKLENNNLSSGIPRTLGSLSSLQSLNMRKNKLSGRLSASLKNLTRLGVLQLDRNELVGSIPAWIGKEFTHLTILNLRSNNFDGNIPHELCYLTAIQILDLADNKLLGNIPRCFNNFSVLTGKENSSYVNVWSKSILYNDILGSALLVTKAREDTYSTILRFVMLLDLSGNNISGQIPSELTTLHTLQSLNLSRNQLIGRIPEKIGDMKSLESFDVSLNQLSGNLPMSLSSLSFLNYFNVSYNSLTGRVPSSTQLQSFSESSFIGNRLCGDPVTERCGVKVPSRDVEEGDKSHDGTDWGLIISIVIGFVAGFWIVVVPLMVSTTWRIAYFHFLSDLSYRFYDSILKYCCNMFPN